jgi:hypothetical protein
MTNVGIFGQEEIKLKTIVIRVDFKGKNPL